MQPDGQREQLPPANGKREKLPSSPEQGLRQDTASPTGRETSLLPHVVKVVNTGVRDDEARIQAIHALLAKEDDRRQRPVDNANLVRRLALELSMPYAEALTAAASKLFREKRYTKKGLIRKSYESGWTNTGEDGLRRESIVKYREGESEGKAVRVSEYEQAIYFNSSTTPDARLKIEMEKGHIKKLRLAGSWDIHNVDNPLAHLGISPALFAFIQELNRTKYIIGEGGDYRMVEVSLPTDMTGPQNLEIVLIDESAKRHSSGRVYLRERTVITYDPLENQFKAMHAHTNSTRSKLKRDVLPQKPHTHRSSAFNLGYSKHSSESMLTITQGFLALIPMSAVTVPTSKE